MNSTSRHVCNRCVNRLRCYCNFKVMCIDSCTEIRDKIKEIEQRANGMIELKTKEDIEVEMIMKTIRFINQEVEALLSTLPVFSPPPLSPDVVRPVAVRANEPIHLVGAHTFSKNSVKIPSVNSAFVSYSALFNHPNEFIPQPLNLLKPKSPVITLANICKNRSSWDFSTDSDLIKHLSKPKVKRLRKRKTSFNGFKKREIYSSTETAKLKTIYLNELSRRFLIFIKALDPAWKLTPKLELSDYLFHRCQVCHGMFHMQETYQERIFIKNSTIKGCSICKIDFIKCTSLYKHLEDYHDEYIRLFKCETCSSRENYFKNL